MAETTVAPASELSGHPTWELNSEPILTHQFSDLLPQQRPRAWDRIPKSPFASKRNRKAKSRKVWKRYEVPLKDKTNETAGQMCDGAGDVEDSGVGENAHATKRLRSKGTAGVEYGEQKPSKYVTTLRDKVPGTPRRKMASRRSLKPDRLNDLGRSVADVEAGPNFHRSPRKMTSRRSSRARRSSTAAVRDEGKTAVASPQENFTGTPKIRGSSRRSLRSGRISMVLTTDIRDAVIRDEASPEKPSKNDAPSAETTVADLAELVILEEEDVDDVNAPKDVIGQIACLEEEPVHEVATDPLQPTQSPSLDDIEEALSSPLVHELIEKDMLIPASSHNPQLSELDSDKILCSPSPHEHVRVEKTKDNRPSPEGTTEGLAQPHGQREQNELASDSVHTESHEDHGLPLLVTSTANQDFNPRDNFVKKSDRDHLAEIPPKSQTVDAIEDNTVDVNTQSPRDVQEVDQPTADSRTASISRSSSPEPNLRRSSRRLSEKKKEAAGVQLVAAAEPTSAATNTTADEEIIVVSPDIRQECVNSTSEGYPHDYQESVLDQHLQVQLHEDMLHENTVSGDADILDASSAEQAVISELDFDASKSSAPDERGNEVGTSNAESHNAKSPQVKHRSRTRFSDDTTMLKDFLSRAQARKLAKDAAPTADLPMAVPSPRRSSRKALGNLDGNSPTRKACELANRPGTPPGKPSVEEAMHAAETAETVAQASPVRRSTRKRLPAPTPAKSATGAPSLIPVRRADGTDPVKLQKSVAQELALVTQTNTRRNKGQAKPPAIILKTLTLGHYEEATKGGHALRNCKNVGWDQKLVYYQDGTEAIVEVESKPEETRPKARRVRGLGAGNGTPAPKKKTADMLSSNGTPGPKRHGRMR
ncbi:MAG: hypothetical protein Q9202_000919 [Teloschistes flavicans]